MMTQLSAQQRTYLEKMKYSGNVLNRILNDILDLSKLEAGKLIIENVPINIPQLLMDSAAIFEAQAKDKGIELTIKSSPQIKPSLIGDPTRINQILTNLVNNAIKFTTKGQIDVSVNAVQQTANAQSLEFCVKDTGIGISKDYLGNIFSEFSQADDSTTRKFGGTGLGLQIAKNLVEQMHGKIWVDQEAQFGSAFYFTLILQESSEPPINLKYAEQQRTQYIGKVLVAEDNEINQIVAKETLLSYGLEVDLANDGQLCIKALENKDYDLILMDLHMPNVDGFEACTEIRKKDPNIPVVALTAAVLKDEIQKALDAGMNAHLSKPLDHVQLDFVLNKYLTKSDK